MMFDELLAARVLTLTIARPPVNAIDTVLATALADRLDAIDDNAVGAVVLSGVPGMFSAGIDVPALLAADPAGVAAFWRAFFRAQRSIAAARVPVVAAITGHSPAGGAVLAMYCDYRIMAAGDFRMGLNEVEIGLCPGPVIHAGFRRLVGARLADQLLARGALLTPAEALAAGMVDRVVAPDDVVPQARAYAGELARLPPRALADTRRVTRADLLAPLELMTDADYAAINAAWFSTETQAGMRAMVAALAARKRR
jgi:Delta3-Delta2-enoyl-CoA isomerase